MKSSHFDLGRPFGGQVHESFCFKSERGDHCARLLDTWEALFPDFNLLGPVFMIMPAPHAVLARVTRQTEFTASLSELIDTRNDLFLDPPQIARGLLVEETGAPGQKRVGFQFFNHAGKGLLKILLTNQSNLEWFGNMVGYYVVPPAAEEPAPPCLPAPPSGISSTDSLDGLRLLWPFFLRNPTAQALAGTAFSRLEAAERIGSALSRPVPAGILGSVLRLAKRYALPLHLRLAGPAGSFQHSMVLRQLETCGGSWHGIGADGDMHFYPAEDQHYRISCYPEGNRLQHFLECFDAQGNFLGSLTSDGTDDNGHCIMWNHWLGHLSE